MVSRAILANFFEEPWTVGLARAFFPTTFLEIAVNDRLRRLGWEADPLSRNTFSPYKRGLKQQQKQQQQQQQQQIKQKQKHGGTRQVIERVVF